MSKNAKYIVVSSKDSKDYFPSNSSENFTVIVDPPLELDGQWNVGLKEIMVRFSTEGSCELDWALKSGESHLMFDVFLSQTTGTLLAGAESMLLRRVMAYPPKKKVKSIHVLYDSPQMSPLRCKNINRLDFFIKPVTMDAKSFGSCAHVYATVVLSKGSD